MKKLMTFILLYGAVSIFSSCVSAQEGVAKDVSVKEFDQLMASKPGTLLDVRTKGEVAKGSIPGSVHIDLFDDNFEGKVEKLDKSKPVYVYCATGGRSSEAMELMNKKGFKEIYNLEGGFSSWYKEHR